MDHSGPGGFRLQVSGPVFSWRGPAPHHFVAVPDDDSAFVQELASAVTYGWGMVPVAARVGRTGFTTSLYPKDGRYLVPLKLAVRTAEGIEVGDTVTIELTIAEPS
ncbi:DUF1905 domain-containing protein [Solicola sp. PLA-1-18]|uniref:DUF1905 domain-containing protein n=1 Tax=Solicola sp. PLA-1-18 TaxID=3380532 RepID=UPI003B79934A